MAESRIGSATPPEFVQQPHLAAVVLVDTSGSMQGPKIGALNEGLRLLKKELEDDELARLRVDLSVVAFNDDVQVIHDFSSIAKFDPPTLDASGTTSLAGAILKAAEMIEGRKREYRDLGMTQFRPWLFVITDAELQGMDMQPGDSQWSQVRRIVHDGEKNKKFSFFLVVADPGDPKALRDIAPPNRIPVSLNGIMFKEMFKWLADSISSTSRSTPGDEVGVQTPMAAGWGRFDS